MLCYPQDHLSRIEPSERWEIFYVTLCGRAALKTMREITGCMGPVFALDSHSRVLAVAANACAAAIESRIESPRHASELAHTLTSSLRDETIGQLRCPTAPRPSSPDFFFEVEHLFLFTLHHFLQGNTCPSGNYLS